jgi:RHS repeat-associated protein
LLGDPGAESYATLTMTYDSGGNEISQATSGPGSGQPNVLLSYTYDQNHNLTSVRDNLSSQGVTSYAYDAGFRLTTTTTSYGGTAGPQVLITYAPKNQISSESRTIGGSGTAVNTSFSYDAADRQTTITDYGSGESSLATYVYSYDDAGRVTTMVDAEGTYTYTYDNANELTNVDENGTQVESYSYDLNGNRTGTGYSTTVMNETLTSPGGITYTYDKAGNMISEDSGGTFTTFTYDYRNRLTEVKQAGTVIATYTYNALNQRIGFKDNGPQTWTIYDGKSPDANPYADFNGSGTMLERYLFGPTVVNGAVMTGILARTSSGGTTAWYLTDKLGSVRDIVSSSGTDLDHIVYDAFGNIVSQSGASYGDRFMFAGMQYDPSTGQYFDHARWFGPTLGRFLQLDPKAFAAGDSNLFRYAFNGPTDGTDTSGLDLGMPSLGDYWNFLTNPGQMDTDLQIGFYGCLTVAAVSLAAVGYLALGSAAAVGASQAAMASEGMAATAAGEAAVAEMGGEAMALGAEAGELSAAEITAELQECAHLAVQQFKMQGFTLRQSLRIALNQNIRAAFQGERIDTFFKFIVQQRNLPVQITGRFIKGPDIISPTLNLWWDLTTQGQWAAHVARYGLNGIPIFY